MTDSIEEIIPSDLYIPYFFTLSRYDQTRALESLIFASDDPLTARAIKRVLVEEDPTQEIPGQQQLPLDGDALPEPVAPRPVFEVQTGYFDELVDEINDELEKTDRPFRIVKIAGGFQFATTPQHGQLVQRLLKAKNRKRLTQAALETLAIVAYRQPITKAEIEAIRGVNSGEVVNSLVEKLLVTIVGRSEAIGKPLLYGTTDEFMRIFGLNSMSDLPKLREIDDLLKTTTTFIETDDSYSVKTDHKTLRKQLAVIMEEQQMEAKFDEEANSGAYWEVEPEPESIPDPEPTSETAPDLGHDQGTERDGDQFVENP
ncbi:hypothetical protein BH10BAC6_BH10BAC6_17260 [soil metagenome]